MPNKSILLDRNRENKNKEQYREENVFIIQIA